MRIAVVSPHYPPMPGGVADSTRRWSLALVRRGAEVTVITSPAGVKTDPDLMVDATQAHWGLADMGGLRARLKAARPDVVLVHYVPHLYQYRGISIAINHAVPRIAREIAPVVTFAHELYYARHEGWWRQPIGWLQRYALWPLFSGSARVVLTVPDRLARMQTVFPSLADRFTLIPIGENIDAAAGVDRDAWRAEQGLAPDELALLFLGLAHPSKELPWLLDVLDRLAEAGVPARLLMAGGGRVVHPRATMLGFLSPAAAGRALASADLYPLPIADGASTRRSSLMNALAAGLPVVSTRGVNTDTSLFSEAPRLVPAGDREAFTREVVALAKDPAARRALGEAGRRLHAREFAWDVLAERWWTLLEEVTHGSAP